MIKEIWTLSEWKNGKIEQVSFELLAWGKKVISNKNWKLCSVVLASEITDEEINKLFGYGSDKVYIIKNEAFKEFLVDPYAKALSKLIQEVQPEIFIAAATTTGRTIMPYVSAMVHGGLTADCTELKIETDSGLLLQTRPAIGGNILATIKTPNHRPQMATVRPKSISLLPKDLLKKGEIKLIEYDISFPTPRVVIEDFIPFTENGPCIENADTVIAGGKGLQSKKKFGLIQELSSLMGGAVGSSRPPVDQGWEPYSTQVGLSGKTISPELYVACGISGSVQHLAGIKTAKNIVAINSDPRAQIFQVSDFGIIVNLFDFLPILIKKMKELKRKSEE